MKIDIDRVHIDSLHRDANMGGVMRAHTFLLFRSRTKIPFS